MSEKITMFTDFVGRTIMGKISETSTETTLSVINPAIVHIQPMQGGKLQVQVLPMIIPEFITSSQRKNDVVVNFAKSALAIPQDLEVDPQLTNQYNRIWSPLIVPTPEAAPVINLFEK